MMTILEILESTLPVHTNDTLASHIKFIELLIRIAGENGEFNYV